MIVILLFYIDAYAKLVAIKQKDGRVVFTNISRDVFFRAAFRNAHSKKKVMALIEKLSKFYGVDVKLVKAIAKIESNYNPVATSSKNAKGVMQLMDKTAQYYGVSDPYDVEENIKGGILFLRHLIEKYHDAKLVAAAYNAGETAVDKYKGIPPYQETRYYVNKFLRVYEGRPLLKIRAHKPGFNITKTKRIINKNGVFTNLRVGLW
ncbi:lytic transglycosylase domain-containing protein [Hippea maritima]|uniref:Lytic transglycosylase catalytic n=1 Tax=Hippea maritima (strain ATCC 700847 / DSM 10411 / MH2) TaxID=760142 RepID=F2LTT2_HIPMA|nr:lytic transglycosylase domain-containing protein [Hippea maritima]AEA34458.1 Lytic transglycosylase catalytic [Hippea maritima DSM 10411]